MKILSLILIVWSLGSIVNMLFAPKREIAIPKDIIDEMPIPENTLEMIARGVALFIGLVGIACGGYIFFIL